MSRPWTETWFHYCEQVYGKVLEGHYRHFCPDLGGLPVDETCVAFLGCHCFDCRCGRHMIYSCRYKPNLSGNGMMLVEWFECPDRRFWNFWKHDYRPDS